MNQLNIGDKFIKNGSKLIITKLLNNGFVYAINTDTGIPYTFGKTEEHLLKTLEQDSFRLMTKAEETAKRNSELMMEVVIKDYCLLKDVCTRLIESKQYALAKDMISKSKHKPHEIILNIVSSVDYQAFNVLAGEFTKELNNEAYTDEDDFLCGTLAEHILEEINAVPIPNNNIRTITDEMRAWVLENYIRVICPKCKSDLTDDDGAGILVLGYATASFNRKCESFEIESSNFEEEDKYLCGECNEVVTDLVKDYM